MLRSAVLFRSSTMSSCVLFAALVACDNTRRDDTSTSPSSEPTSPTAIERTGGSDEEARDTSGNPASGNLGAGERTSQRGAGGSSSSGPRLEGTAGGGGTGGAGGMRSTR
jgi:hypothetical protein